MDDRSHATALARLSDIESPLARALVWGAVWDAARDAEIPASAYVDLVLAHIAPETESTTLRLTLTQLLTAARLYVAPAKHAATIARIGDALWDLATGADAGSDAQFQFVKFFANAASSTAHAESLRSLLDGSTTLPGLEIDDDLGWELLEGLVLAGGAGEEEIAARLEGDNTANGQQAAARVRAAIPTAAAKRAAFQAGSRDGSIPNTILRNMGLGYQHVNDPVTLESLVAPYFEMLEGVWRNRTYKIAEYIVDGFYPTPLASQALVDATEEWLSENDEIPALRRLIVENLATVQRALLAQKRDARG
jgi:aminopeptidase N